MSLPYQDLEDLPGQRRVMYRPLREWFERMRNKTYARHIQNYFTTECPFMLDYMALEVDISATYQQDNGKGIEQTTFNLVSPRGFVTSVAFPVGMRELDKLDVTWYTEMNQWYTQAALRSDSSDLKVLNVEPWRVTFSVKHKQKIQTVHDVYNQFRCNESEKYDEWLTYPEEEIVLVTTPPMERGKLIQNPTLNSPVDLMQMLGPMNIYGNIDYEKSWIGDPLKDFAVRVGVPAKHLCMISEEAFKPYEARCALMKDAWKYFSSMRSNVIGVYTTILKRSIHVSDPLYNIPPEEDSTMYTIIRNALRPKQIQRTRKRRRGGTRQVTDTIGTSTFGPVFMLIAKSSTGKIEIYSDQLGTVSPTRYGAPTLLRYLLQKGIRDGNLDAYFSLKEGSVTIDELIEATYELELMKALT